MGGTALEKTDGADEDADWSPERSVAENVELSDIWVAKGIVDEDMSTGSDTDLFIPVNL